MPVLPARPAAPAFPLSDSDRAFLHRIESLIHRIADRIDTYTSQHDPATNPPPPQRWALVQDYFPYPREYRLCVGTLHMLHSLWHSIKALLNAPAPASPAAPRPAGASPFAAARPTAAAVMPPLEPA